MDNFDLKKFVSGKSLLNENAPGYDTRKTGEPLPTLASVKAAYEAKNGINEDIATLSDILDDLKDILKTWETKKYASDEARWKEYYKDIENVVKFHETNVSESKNLTEGIITEAKKSEIDKKLAEIDKAGRITTLEAKIAAIDEAVEAKNNRISMVQEDENLSELIDKKRVKEMQKEIKLLEKSKKLYEKQLDKENGKKAPKKEIVDEYNTEPHDTPDASDDATMSEDFDSVVDDIMDQGKSKEDAEKIAGAINAKYVGNYR
jgi:hypothetical protein